MKKALNHGIELENYTELCAVDAALDWYEASAKSGVFLEDDDDVLAMARQGVGHMLELAKSTMVPKGRLEPEDFTVILPKQCNVIVSGVLRGVAEADYAYPDPLPSYCASMLEEYYGTPRGSQLDMIDA